jgi:hypothetical protein
VRPPTELERLGRPREELGRPAAMGERAAGRSPAGARLQAELGRRRRSAAAGGPRAEQAEPWPRSSSCYGGGERGREKIG